MQTLVRKKFVLYYTSEFKPEFEALPILPMDQRIRFVEGMDFFTLDNGFSVYDIDDIGNMDPMDAINISFLKIWRVE